MTDGISNATSGVGAFPQGFEGLSTEIAAQLQQQIQADPGKVLEEIAQLAQTLQPGLGKSGGNSVSNGNGAPQIDGVTLNFSPEDMAAALLVLQGKTQEAQLKTAKEGIEINSQKQKIQNDKAMKKIEEWIKKCEDAAAKEKAGGILGWFKKIFSVIAAVFAVVAAAAATAATGGAAAPLLALAVLSLASATVSLASEISKAAGGPDFDHVAGWMDLGSLVGKGMGELAKAFGADEQQVAIVSATFAMATTIAITAASVVLTGGATAAAEVGKIAKMAMDIGRAGQAIVGVASGLTEAAQGGVKIAAAHDTRAAATAQADKKKIDALIAALQQQMEENREEIKKVIDEMMEGMNIVSRMINAAGQSREQISSNMTGRSRLV